MEETVPGGRNIHKASGVTFITNKDINDIARLFIRWNRTNLLIKILTDKQGNLFVSLSSIARNFFYRNWTDSFFAQAVIRSGVTVYKTAYNANAYAVHVDSVSDIIEEFVTVPYDNNEIKSVGKYVEYATEFLDWWNSKARNLIEKQTKRAQATLPSKPVENISEQKEGIGLMEDKDSLILFDYIKSSDKKNICNDIVNELEMLAIQIQRLVEAGLSRELAIPTAIKLRRNMYRRQSGDKSLFEDYKPIIKFVEVINPCVVDNLDRNIE